MKPTRAEFRGLKQAKPGTVLLFENGNEYSLFGFDAVLAGKTLGSRTRLRPVGDGTLRSLVLLSAELSGAISEIKRCHFGIKVEIIR
jgi:hypothetical protein